MGGCGPKEERRQPEGHEAGGLVAGLGGGHGSRMVGGLLGSK
jgi:hypothetical protein